MVNTTSIVVFYLKTRTSCAYQLIGPVQSPLLYNVDKYTARDVGLPNGTSYSYTEQIEHSHHHSCISIRLSHPSIHPTIYSSSHPFIHQSHWSIHSYAYQSIQDITCAVSILPYHHHYHHHHYHRHHHIINIFLFLFSLPQIHTTVVLHG